MSNMSYCMFRNTESDLTDCLSLLQQNDGVLSSHQELESAENIMQICRELLEWEGNLDTEEEEE